MDSLRFGARVVRRWWWLILLLGAVSSVTTMAVSLELPKVYEATTVALVNPKQLIPQTSTGSADTALPTIDELVLTYSQLVNTAPVRQHLITDGIPRTSEQLRQSISTTREPNTTLVDITVRDQDPAVAQLIASDIIPAYNKSLDELQTNAGGDIKTRLEALVVADVPREAPKTPASPRVPVNGLLALLVGMIVGSGVASVLERLDNTVKAETDVRLQLGIPLLGNVQFRPEHSDPNAAPEDVELVTATRPKDPLSESYRALRTNVLFSRIDQGAGAILVTSTIPGEGKTTTACNLAIIMAQAGHRVILVDADFRRPDIHRVFGLTANHGLSEVILDPSAAKNLIIDTKIPNLQVLPSGPTPPNPSELLGSQAMDRLIGLLKEDAGVVIFDTPPVGAVTDATVLASITDGVVLVVEPRRTPIPQIQRALETLRTVGADVLGAVLNKTREVDPSTYYYYHYSRSDRDDGARSGRSMKSENARARMTGEPSPVPKTSPPSS